MEDPTWNPCGAPVSKCEKPNDPILKESTFLIQEQTDNVRVSPHCGNMDRRHFMEILRVRFSLLVKEPEHWNLQSEGEVGRLGFHGKGKCF